MTDHTAEPDWLHLKAYGYAPGNYMSRCCHCNGTFAGLDKRATSCRACAEKLHDTKGAAPSLTVGDVPVADLDRALMVADVLACGERGDKTVHEAGNMLRMLAMALKYRLAAQAEPVAWRYRPGFSGPWSLTDDGYEASCRRSKGYTVQDLVLPSHHPAQGIALPAPGSPEASAMIDSVLAEYEWPSNTKNAARAGYVAATRMLAQAQKEQP